jgi:hypothetical protein
VGTQKTTKKMKNKIEKNNFGPMKNTIKKNYFGRVEFVSFGRHL